MSKIATYTKLIVRPKKYMYVTSPGHDFVWFQNPKAATRTILYFLKAKTELEGYDKYRVYRPLKFINHYKFAFVRNPWDRLVSVYEEKIVQKKELEFYSECFGKDFDYFLNFVSKKDLNFTDGHIRLQSTLFPVEIMDFVGRLENFEKDFNTVLDRIGLEGEPYKHLNKSQKKGTYHEYYTNEQAELVGKLYKQDIKTFGYSF